MKIIKSVFPEEVRWNLECFFDRHLSSPALNTSCDPLINEVVQTRPIVGVISADFVDTSMINMV